MTLTSVQAAGLPRLHTQGDQILDDTNHVITLRGINLGGWLVEEPWMQPFVTSPPAGSGFRPIRDHVSLWATVERRFGEAGLERMRAAFRDDWLNESDFDRIHDAGLNCVRLPFLASLADEPNGLQWLDRAVSWAGKRGIYVILDLHGAPGGQSDQDHTGQEGQNAFFRDPANVEKAVNLWARLARRYKDNTTVAGYDLINEPTSAQNAETLYVVQDRLYRAVRAVDTRHLIIIEDGYKGLQGMPYPGPCGWQNVVYSRHYYRFDSKSDADQQEGTAAEVAAIEKLRQSRQVPFYLGEFGLEPYGTTETQAGLLNALQSKNISWSMWTYKVIFRHGGLSLWGLFTNSKPLVSLDPYNDTEADWVRKCGQFRSENLTENAALAQGFRQAAGIPDGVAPH